MQGLKISIDQLVEILATYTATMQPVPAVVASPGWYVVGAFRMPADFEVVLAAIACVSDPSLTLRARLFDLSSTPPAPVSVTLGTSSTVDERVLSATVALDGGHDYQMQVEVTGGSSESYFGSLKSLGLVAAT